MWNRCTNENDHSYPHYGGRGIGVCERWKQFTNFLEDMGEAPAGLTLDRRDNDGPYSRDNCRWTTVKKQANNRRSTTFVTVNGIRMSTNEAAEIVGVSSQTIRYRLRHGMSEAAALGLQQP